MAPGKERARMAEEGAGETGWNKSRLESRAVLLCTGAVRRWAASPQGSKTNGSQARAVDAEAARSKDWTLRPERYLQGCALFSLTPACNKEVTGPWPCTPQLPPTWMSESPRSVPTTALTCLGGPSLNSHFGLHLPFSHLPSPTFSSCPFLHPPPNTPSHHQYLPCCSQPRRPHQILQGPTSPSLPS